MLFLYISTGKTDEFSAKLDNIIFDFTLNVLKC